MKKKYNYPKKRNYLEMTKNSKHIASDCSYLRKYFKKRFKKIKEHYSNKNFIIKENSSGENLEEKKNNNNFKNENFLRLIASKNPNNSENTNEKKNSIDKTSVMNNNIASKIKNTNKNMINKELYPIFLDNNEIKINLNKIKCEEFKYIKSYIFEKYTTVPDGNCLYRCISKYLFQNEDSYYTLIL